MAFVTDFYSPPRGRPHHDREPVHPGSRRFPNLPRPSGQASKWHIPPLSDDQTSLKVIW